MSFSILNYTTNEVLETQSFDFENEPSYNNSGISIRVPPNVWIFVAESYEYDEQYYVSNITTAHKNGGGMYSDSV